MDRLHYERAFEQSLRNRRIPYVSVDDARKALLPEGGGLSAAFLARADGAGGGASGADGGQRVGIGGGLALKSFDFVLYSERVNLLVDVKGRKVAGRQLVSGGPRGGSARLECWVTEDDCRSLRVWSQLFGAGFRSACGGGCWCVEQPPAGRWPAGVADPGRRSAIRA
ncbi:MAG: HYExAFE family protein, partial [Planctomyces sp.]